MDFNMKKLASDAGVFFTRAVQVSETNVLRRDAAAARCVSCVPRLR